MTQIETSLEILTKNVDSVELVKKACTDISEYFINTNDKNMSSAIHLMLATCNHKNSGVRMVAKEKTKKMIKFLLIDYPEQVITCLFENLSKNESSIAAFENLSESAIQYIKPNKSREFVIKLIPILKQMISSCDLFLLQTIAANFEQLLTILGVFINEKEFNILFEVLIQLLNNSSIEIRRSTSKCLYQLCRFTKSCPFLHVCKTLYELAIKADSDSTMKIDGYLLALKDLSNVLQVIHENNSSSQTASILKYFCEMVCDLMINVNTIMTSSLELLNYILYNYPNYCKRWSLTKGLYIHIYD